MRNLEILSILSIDTTPGRSAREWFEVGQAARRAAAEKGEEFRNMVQPKDPGETRFFRPFWEWV